MTMRRVLGLASSVLLLTSCYVTPAPTPAPHPAAVPQSPGTPAAAAPQRVRTLGLQRRVVYGPFYGHAIANSIDLLDEKYLRIQLTYRNDGLYRKRQLVLLESPNENCVLSDAGGRQASPAEIAGLTATGVRVEVDAQKRFSIGFWLPGGDGPFRFECMLLVRDDTETYRYLMKLANIDLGQFR